MSAGVENSEAAILSRVISPDNANLFPDAANSILQISFPRTDLDRTNFLAEKARTPVTVSSVSKLTRYSDTLRGFRIAIVENWHTNRL
jgi:hypothetical protein